MAKAKKKPASKRVRDAVTGEFVDKAQAKKRPGSTVTETVKKRK